MSVYDYLQKNEVNRIVDVIRQQCNSEYLHEKRMSMSIDKELYKRLQKGRRAHDITGKIYIGFFYPANSIEGFNVNEVENGIYSQPELIKGSIVIHVYHNSNRLESSLIQEKAKDNSIQYFCFMYSVDDEYRLKKVDVISFHDGNQEKETVYELALVINESA